MRGLDASAVMGTTGLSLAVHAALVAALALGVSWRNQIPLPIQANLWSELPPLVVTPPAASEMPQAAPVQKPDIALQKAQARAAARQQAKVEQERLRAEREQARRDKRDKLRSKAELEQQMREAAAELEAEAAALQQQRAQRVQRMSQAQQAAQRRLLEAQDHIRGKIRGLLRLPPSLKGNPEVVYRVTLLPNDEVSDVKLVTSSGQPEYDAAVERAILKASPLPLPADAATARQFRDGLILRFRPQEG